MAEVQRVYRREEEAQRKEKYGERRSTEKEEVQKKEKYRERRSTEKEKVQREKKYRGSTASYACKQTRTKPYTYAHSVHANTYHKHARARLHACTCLHTCRDVSYGVFV